MHLCVCVCVCRQTQSKCVNEHISAARFILRNWLTPLRILSGVCRVGQLTGASEESWHCSSSSNIVHCRLSSSREVSLFLLRPSSGWMRPVHIMEGSLLYSKVTDLSVVCVLVAQLCPTLCDPMDCSPPGSSVHEISREGYWSGLPFLSPGDLPNPGIDSRSPVLQADSLPTELQGKSHDLILPSHY